MLSLRVPSYADVVTGVSSDEHCKIQLTGSRNCVANVIPQIKSNGTSVIVAVAVGFCDL